MIVENTGATGGTSDAGLPDASEPVTCAGQTCAPNERCNVWTRICQPFDVPYPPPGQDNGGPCTTEADCRSAGSGLPNHPLCGSVCLPSDLRYQPDDTIGTCVPECQSDDTCRTEDGYYCRTTYIYPPRTFTNGYCAPSHCKSRGCAGVVCGC